MRSALTDNRTWIWAPLVVGILFPPLAMMVTQTTDGDMLRTLAGYFSTVSDEPFWVVPARVLWNLVPFAVIFLGAQFVSQSRRPNRVRAASLFGTLAAIGVFIVFYSDARSALDAERWTASAIATGMAPLYAVPVALGAFALGVFAGSSAESKQMPSNSTPHTDARASAVLDQPPPGARAGGRGRQIAGTVNKAEAKAILSNELERYRAMPYGELTALVGNSRRTEVTAPSGAWYQVVVQALWDDPSKPNEVLRIAGAIDDGGIRAYVPLTDSFLVSPTGEVVGE